MCGIAGIMFKGDVPAELSTGRALVQMLDGCQHRGPDSTGFALYSPAREEELRLRFFVGEGDEANEAITRLAAVFDEHDAAVVEGDTVGHNYRVTVKFNGDLQRFAYAVEHAAKVVSIGSSLEIVKDVGSAHDVDERYDVGGFEGSHGLGIAFRIGSRQEDGVGGAVAGEHIGLGVQDQTPGGLDAFVLDAVVLRLSGVVFSARDLDVEEPEEENAEQQSDDGENRPLFTDPLIVGGGIHLSSQSSI